MTGQIWQNCFHTHHDVGSASRWEAEVITVCQDPAATMAVRLCEVLPSTRIRLLAEGLICHPVNCPQVWGWANTSAAQHSKSLSPPQTKVN